MVNLSMKLFMNDEKCVIYEWFMSYLLTNHDEFVNYYLLIQNENIDCVKYIPGNWYLYISGLIWDKSILVVLALWMNAMIVKIAFLLQNHINFHNHSDGAYPIWKKHFQLHICSTSWLWRREVILTLDLMFLFVKYMIISLLNTYYLGSSSPPVCPTPKIKFPNLHTWQNDLQDKD